MRLTRPGWAALRVLALLGIVAFVSCCRPKPPAPIVKPAPEIRLTHVYASCLSVPPPRGRAFAPLGEDLTPPYAVACFDDKNGAQLDRYLAELEVWAAAAWERCKQSPKPEVPP